MLGGGQGEYRTSTFKVIDTIPTEAVFLENDPVNDGWEPVPDRPRTYTKTVTNGSTNIPIALSFPNQPYNGNSTATFTNSSDFYYHNGNDFVEAGLNKTATTSFYVREEVSGNFRWGKWANEVTNVVNVDKDVHNSSVFYKPNSNANAGSKVYPRTGESDQHKAFTYRVEFDQWQRDNNEQTHYLYKYVDTNQGIQRASDGSFVQNLDSISKTKGRMYYKSVTVNKAIFNDQNTRNVTKETSTVDWINENTRFKVYKTFSPIAGYPFTRTPNSGQNEKTGNLDETQKVLVAEGKLGDTIEINDEGGYYTGIAVVFDEESLNNTDQNGNPIRALPIRNIKFNMDFTMLPVKAGSVSRGENNEIVFTAPKSYDLLQNFSDHVLNMVGDGKNSNNLERAKNSYLYYATYASPALEVGNYSAPPVYRPVVNINQFSEDGDGRFPGDGYDNNHTYFRPNFPKLDLNTSSDGTYFYSSDPSEMEHTATFEGRVSTDAASLAIPGSVKIKNLKGIVLLPTGVEYVRTTNFGNSQGEPKIVENFKNTGRTALVYDFGDTEETHTGTIRYTVRLTKYAKDAASAKAGENPGNTVDTWLSWDNNLTVLANGGSTADIMDLNNDDSDSRLDHRNYNLFLYMPKEIILKKSVSLDNRSWALETPFQDIDGDVYFQVRVINKWTSAIKKMTAVDILSSRGDYKTVANKDGIYLLRGSKQTGSDFNVRLAGPIEEVEGNGTLQSDGEYPYGTANEKFTFYYSTAIPRQENPDVVDPASWRTRDQIGANEWERVTAIKFVLKEGHVIPAIPDADASEEERRNWVEGSNEVGVFIHGRTENSKDIADQKVAYNSGAYMQGSARLLNEGNEVNIRTIRYTVSGKAFRDYNMNGNISNNLVSNIRARLVYAASGTDSQGNEFQEGDPVPAAWVDSGKLDENGKIVTKNSGTNETITDAEGNYYFIVYKRGQYRVEFTRDTDVASGRVENPQEQKFVQCGPPTGKDRSNLNKTWSGTYANVDTVNSTDFVLNPDVLRYNNDSTLDYWGNNIHQYRNVAINDGRQDVKIHKLGLDKDDRTVGSLAGTRFSLYKRVGNVQGELAVPAQTTDEQGNLTFKALPYGEYFLIEESATEGYRIIPKVKMTLTGRDCNAPITSGGITFENAEGDTTNSANRFTYDAENGLVTVSNSPILGKLEITKLGNDNQRPLQGVVFELHRFGKPIIDNSDPENPKPLTAVTNADGVAIFDQIAGGEYTVKEIKPATGYNTIDGDINLKTTGKNVTVPADPNATTTDDNKAQMRLGNNPVTASIKVTKKDSDSEAPIQNTEFSVYRKNSGDTEPTGNPVYKKLTNETGIALFENVPYGEYFVKETKAANGYVINSDVYTVRIEQQDRIYNPTFGTWVKNAKYKSDVKIKKVDAENTNTVLEGARYGLYACTGQVQDNGLKACQDSDLNANPAYTVTTGTDGTATFNNVTFGSYKLKEIQAPNKYALSTQVTDVNVVPNPNNPQATLIDLSTTPVTNTIIKGRVSLTKVDSADTTLRVKGAKFALFAKQEDGTFAQTPFTYGQTRFEQSTDNNGNITFEGVPYGEYQLKETTAPKEYQLGDDVRTITINTDGQVVNFTQENTQDSNLSWFTNDPKLYSISLTKLDEENNVLQGAKFSLFKARNTGTNGNDNWVKDGSAIAEQTTAQNGKLQFENIRMGTYIVEETQAPEGYLLAAPQTVTASGDHNTVIEVSVTDTKIIGAIRFTKVDADNYAKDPKVYTPLKGVTFGIFKAIQQNGTWVKTGDALQTIVTKENGVVHFENLEKGHYIVEELSPMTGYVLSLNPSVHMEISEHGRTLSPTVDGYVTNNMIKGSVRVHKVGTTDAEGTNTVPLENVEFVLKQGDAVKYTARTNKQGIAEFTNVVYGEYTLAESQTVEGYNPSTQTRNVNIDTNEKQVVFDAQEGENARFVNEIITGTLIINKHAAHDQNLPLENAVFELSQNGKVKYTLRTNKDGVAELSGIVYGTYDLSEKTAPVGYNIVENLPSVTISENGQEISRTIADQIITGTVKVKKLGTLDAKGTSTKPLQDVTFQLVPENTSHDTLVATTDENGIATFENVYYGKYTLSEKATLPNYNLVTDTLEVNVTEQNGTYGYDSNNSDETLNNFVFTNTIIRNDVVVKKVDADSNEAVADAEFALFACTGPTQSPCTDGAVEDTPSYTAVSTDNGEAKFEDVLHGTYILRETKAPHGYAISDTEKTVIVETQKNAENDNFIDMENIANPVITGKVAFTKVAEKCNKPNTDSIVTLEDQQKTLVTCTKLSGAKFELRPVDGDLNSKFDRQTLEATSGDGGSVEFTDVTFGNYEIVETQAPTGYELLKDPIKVSVSEHGKLVLLDPVENKAIPKPKLVRKAKLTNTGTNADGIALTAIILLTLSGLAFRYTNRRKDTF